MGNNLMSQLEIPNYRLVQALDEGGFGVVFEAVNVETGGRAAIKVLRPEHQAHPSLAARLLWEARALGQLNHPGIVGIKDAGKLAHGALYVVMEYLEGQTLRQRMKAEGRLKPEIAVRFTRQLASALAAVHAKGIVHRDLKPANVMLVQDPEVPGGERTKLIDFGIMKGLNQELLDELTSPRTKTGEVLGTPSYMAPEQWTVERIDGRTDVYALGILLFFLLAGRLPFEAANQLEMMQMHTHSTPPSLAAILPDLSPALVELVGRMMDKDVDNRPTMQEVHGLLREQVDARSLTSGETLMAVQETGPLSLLPSELLGPVAAPSQWARPVAWFTGLALIVGVAVLLGAALWNRRLAVPQEDSTAAIPSMIPQRLPPSPPAEERSVPPSDPPGTRAPKTPAVPAAAKAHKKAKHAGRKLPPEVAPESFVQELDRAFLQPANHSTH